MTFPAIEAEGLTKSYGKSRGIEDVSFAVAPGEVFGFLGPNGAGKTTTIRALLDMHHPTGGSARLFGLDSRRDCVAIRARLGNLPGDFGFGRQGEWAESSSLEDLRALPGVSEFTVADGRASFEVAGDFDHVLKALATHHVELTPSVMILCVGGLEPEFETCPNLAL